MSTPLPETALCFLSVCLSSRLPVLKTPPLMFQSNKQQQCRRETLQREAAVFSLLPLLLLLLRLFFFLWWSIPPFPPTHAARSANISHHNGKRLFVEELHIGPPPSATHPRSPIGYRSLSCFVSFSSVARFQPRPPCEHKTGLGRAKTSPLPTSESNASWFDTAVFGFFFFAFFFSSAGQLLLLLLATSWEWWFISQNFNLLQHESELWSSSGWERPIMLFAFS